MLLWKSKIGDSIQIALEEIEQHEPFDEINYFTSEQIEHVREYAEKLKLECDYILLKIWNREHDS